jgi:teichuronic acid biosynthesis glycosyltransferase TuaG
METFITEKPFVDVILPNYNKAEFLEEAINSVISQSYKNWTLLIIDDFSNDDSSKIILKYKNEKNVKIIFLNKNKGVSFCRNLGIRLSNSKYIAFIDSDDYWVKDKLMEQISFMEKLNYEFTYTNYTPFTLKKNLKHFKKIILPPDSFNFKEFIHNTSIGMSSVVIKRSIIRNIIFKKLKICEDYLFKCEILKSISTARKFNQNTMFYRITKNSLQSSKLRNIYSIWLINKKYNKLKIFNNLKSILFIIINSIKKYGIK